MGQCECVWITDIAEATGLSLEYVPSDALWVCWYVWCRFVFRGRKYSTRLV